MTLVHTAESRTWIFTGQSITAPSIPAECQGSLWGCTHSQTHRHTHPHLLQSYFSDPIRFLTRCRVHFSLVCLHTLHIYTLYRVVYQIPCIIFVSDCEAQASPRIRALFAITPFIHTACITARFDAFCTFDTKSIGAPSLQTA